MSSQYEIIAPPHILVPFAYRVLETGHYTTIWPPSDMNDIVRSNNTFIYDNILHGG